MRAVRERIALFCRSTRERFHVVDLEGKMGEIRADDDRTTFVKLTDLDLFFAPRSFEEYQFGASTRSMAPGFLKSQDVTVKRDRFFKIRNAITGVEQLFDHEDCEKGYKR